MRREIIKKWKAWIWGVFLVTFLFFSFKMKLLTCILICTCLSCSCNSDHCCWGWSLGKEDASLHYFWNYITSKWGNQDRKINRSHFHSWWPWLLIPSRCDRKSIYLLCLTWDQFSRTERWVLLLLFQYIRSLT